MIPDITPNEILQKKFSTSFRGLKPEEVNDFLKIVAFDFEEALRRNLQLEEKIRQLEEAVEESRHLESTLKNTLISSQKIGQEIKDEAERKSNILIREAELEAEIILQKAKQRKERLEEETFQLLNQHRRFRAEFASLIDTHRKMIQAQDSRLLLDQGSGNAQDTHPAVEPEIEPADSSRAPKHRVGEEELKDLEIILPGE